MKKDLMKFVLALGVMTGGLILVGWAGSIDYTEHVILHMSQEEYDSVKCLLTKEHGEEPSESDIAEWWVEHNCK